MEGFSILIFLLLGIFVFIIFVIAIGDNAENPTIRSKQNYRKNTKPQYNSSYSEQTYNSSNSESESVRNYKEILDKAQTDWKEKNVLYTGKAQKGKNGGRYRLRETKDGKKYRQYY